MVLLYSSSREERRNVTKLKKQVTAQLERKDNREVCLMHRKPAPQKLMTKQQFSLVCAKHHRQLWKRVPVLCSGHVEDPLTVVVGSKDLMHWHSVCALCLVTLQFRSCHCVIC